MATTTLNVRLSGELSDHVAANTGEHGLYESVSEYVRDLIRHDWARAEEEKLQALKAELERAFAATDADFHDSSPDDVLARVALREGI